MKKNAKLYRSPLSMLALLMAVVMTLPFIEACNKSNTVTPVNGIATQINVVNLSPDMGGLYLYLNGQQYNTLLKPYIYGTPSGYISVLYTATPFQLRTRQNVIYFTRTSNLVENNRYTIFTTGLVGDKTPTYIFATDSDSAPKTGRGKVRFVNAASRSINFDVTANGTTAFSNCAIKTISSYIEMPAGIYDFKFYNTGTTDALVDLPNITIQDGRLYTLYTRGVVGRTDTAAIAAAVITNR